MGRLIDADAACEYLKNVKKAKNNTILAAIEDVIIKFINKQPTVDAEPVRHGKWILEREPDGNPYCFHCSACDDDFHYVGIKTASKYCPNCGAKMDAE